MATPGFHRRPFHIFIHTMKQTRFIINHVAYKSITSNNYETSDTCIDKRYQSTKYSYWFRYLSHFVHLIKEHITQPFVSLSISYTIEIKKNPYYIYINSITCNTYNGQSLLTFRIISNFENWLVWQLYCNNDSLYKQKITAF